MGLSKKSKIAIKGALAAAFSGAALSVAPYIYYMNSAEPLGKDAAEACIVSTGGDNRIRTALLMLAEGQCGRLLVSGAQEGNTLEMMLDHVPDLAIADLKGQEDLIEFGHASDTIGNGIEAVEWIAQKDFHDVAVITSDYHLPRALYDLYHARDASGADFSVRTVPVDSDDTLRNYMREILKLNCRLLPGCTEQMARNRHVDEDAPIRPAAPREYPVVDVEEAHVPAGAP